MNPPAPLARLTSAQLKELVVELLHEVAALKQTVGSLREEVARLKGLKGRPDIQPSGMDAATAPTHPREPGRRRRPAHSHSPPPAPSASPVGPAARPEHPKRARRPIRCKSSCCRRTRSV